jgi:predicted  nucleic acid-binding Zn-ribbon protein
MTMDPLDASVVLAPYLEPVVRGRRVGVIGDCSGRLGPELVERGARLVHVYDPDPSRVARECASRPPSRSLVLAPLPAGDMGVRDGAFDTVLVPDLGAFEDAAGVVTRAARLVSAGGVAVVCARNPEAPGGSARDTRPGAGPALGYYELYDAVSLQFPEVRMLGQAPFVGWVVADFAPDEEPDVTVDTSLLERGAEEPRWFVALASRRPTRLDAYSIVQLPAASFAPGGPAPGLEAPEARAELAELERVRAQLAGIEQARAELARGQDELRASEARAHELETRAGDAHVRAERLEHKVRDLEEELRAQRDRAFRLSRDLEEEKKHRTRVEIELGMARRTPELAAKPEPEPAAVEILESLAEAERRLEEQTGRADGLERELGAARARTQQLERSLCLAADGADDLRASVTQAERRAAELARALEDRDAKIAALDATLVEMTASPPDDAEARRHLEEAAQARDEALATVAEMQAHHEGEVARLESALLERARELAALRREVEHREGLVRELLLTLEEASPGACGAAREPGEAAESLRGQLDRLGALAARKEAELQAARWRLQELEARLSEAAAPAAPSAEIEALEKAVVAAHAEVDALRTALLQERGQRERAENASAAHEALTQAQADLQEQSVLHAGAAGAPEREPGPG